jgi:hypothetical protein
MKIEKMYNSGVKPESELDYLDEELRDYLKINKDKNVYKFWVECSYVKFEFLKKYIIPGEK